MMLRAVEGVVTLAVRARPGAKKTGITGTYGDGDNAQLKIAVHAPPLDGRANQALITFLADIFSWPARSIELLSGGSSRSKVILLRGLPLADAKGILHSLLVR